MFVIKSYDVASECIRLFNCSVSDVIRKKQVSNKITAVLRKHITQTFCKEYYWQTGYWA